MIGIDYHDHGTGKCRRTEALRRRETMMNLRELEYLVALADERHFHKAAARCFVSQPTLSGQLKKLEQELGVVLVERTNRRVSMTEAGTEIARQARAVLAGVRQIRETAATFEDPMSGELRLGIIPTLAPYLLPLIIPALNRRYAKLKFWLYEYQTRVLLQKLRQAELDLLLLALPVETEEFSRIDLFREPFRLAVRKNHRLVKNKSLTLADLRGQPMLLLEEGHCLRGQVLDVCSRARAAVQAHFQATSLETLRQMVAEGMGMTLIPELAVPARPARAGQIRYLEFSDPKPARRIGLLYRKGSYRAQCFAAVAETIQAALPVGVFF